jgi:CHAT domain-containing protein/Tfp pilus assembly protein PilF
LALFCAGQDGAGQGATSPAARFSSAAPLPAAQVQDGTLVGAVARGKQADKAGLRPGDILFSWKGESARGNLESPFALEEVEAEWGARGAIILTGIRSGSAQTWKLGSGDWGLETHPRLPASLIAQYNDDVELAASGNPIEGANRLRALAASEAVQSPKWLSAWLSLRAGEWFASATQAEDAARCYQQALQAEGVAGSAIAVQIARSIAEQYRKHSDWAAAQAFYEKALAASLNLGHREVTSAAILNGLGIVNGAKGDLKAAEEYHRQALAVAQSSAPGSLILARTLNLLGSVLWKRGDLAGSENLQRQALEVATRVDPEGLDVASILANLGRVYWKRGALDKAEENLTRALALEEKLDAGSLEAATVLNMLGVVSWNRGNLDKAQKYHDRALALREKAAPGSLDVANSLTNLGLVARQRGDLTQAEIFQGRALQIRQRLAPGSLDVAATFNNLGILSWERGDLSKGENYFSQSLEIRQKFSPGSLDVANTLHNMGIIAWERGDLSAAEKYDLQALSIKNRLAPESLDFASTLDGLGVIAKGRGDSGRALQYEQRAWAIRRKLAPDTIDEGTSLHNLADLALAQEDLEKADSYFRRGLAIDHKYAPDSLDEASDLVAIGNVLRQRGDGPGATEYYRRALAIQQKLAPESPPVAATLFELGEAARQSGDRAEAEDQHRHALAIRQNLAPESMGHAESLAAVARVVAADHRPEEALKLFASAVDAIEGQTAHLGGPDEVRSNFRYRHGDLYQDYIELLLENGQADVAFHVLERSRARTLLETLAAARIDIRRGAEPGLLAQERSLRELIGAKSDRRLRLMSEEHTAEQLTAANKEIEPLLTQYRALQAQIRDTSPAYAALTQPTPLTAVQVQKELLDPDTVLLEYALGPRRSHVWMLSQDLIVVRDLPPRKEIEQLAGKAIRLLTSRNRIVPGETEAQRDGRFARDDAAYVVAGVQLSQMLLGPVATMIRGKRLLIVSDGVLQYVPFAALPAPSTKPRTELVVPLVAQHEIVNLPSASVLVQLRREAAGRKPAEKLVAVLADPVFDASDPRVAGKLSASSPKGSTQRGAVGDAGAEQDSADDHLLRSLAGPVNGSAERLHLERLRFTRREADAIIATVPPGKGMKAVDFDATLALATSRNLAQYRIVHFATHGLLDNTHPELSGLVFSLVTRNGQPQKGFLELADIYNLELPVDLVVLSACETGLGKEVGGEGLVGLTRGFMYAGATRVMASLWKISDAATAHGMSQFYQAMQQGKKSPAASLRQAQLRMWRQKRWSAPYYWAAFEVQGDWR